MGRTRERWHAAGEGSAMTRKADYEPCWCYGPQRDIAPGDRNVMLSREHATGSPGCVYAAHNEPADIPPERDTRDSDR
jgi:hypothetical protein